MSYAEEREYSPRQKAVVVLDFIYRHGSITIAQAMAETGLSRVEMWRLLLDIEGAIARVRKRGRVWVYAEG